MRRDLDVFETAKVAAGVFWPLAAFFLFAFLVPVGADPKAWLLALSLLPPACALMEIVRWVAIRRRKGGSQACALVCAALSAAVGWGDVPAASAAQLGVDAVAFLSILVLSSAFLLEERSRRACGSLPGPSLRRDGSSRREIG